MATCRFARLAGGCCLGLLAIGGDNRGMPFAIVDKAQAKVFVFYVDGRLRAAAQTRNT
jgi:hypothetical protein